MGDNTLWYTRCPLPTAFSVAIHAGFLGQHVTASGGDVQSLRHSNDQAIRLSHFTHTYPGMIRQGGHIPPLWSRSEGKPVKLIGLSHTNEAQLVLTLPSSPIRKVSDLKGRRLAVPVRRNFPIDFWRATVLKGWSNVLATAGLSLRDVVLVDIHVDDQPFVRQFSRPDSVAPPGTAYQTLSSQRLEGHALLRHEVDAIFSPGHYGVALSAFLGADVLFDLSTLDNPLHKINNSTLLAFTVDADFLDRHPETVIAALRASFAGAAYARSHPREAARIVAAESGNAEELIPTIFGDDFATDLVPQFSDTLLEALAQQNHFLFQQGFIRRQVPIDEWIEPALLEKAALTSTPFPTKR